MLKESKIDEDTYTLFMGENTMHLASILFTLMSVVPSSAPSSSNIVGTWSEFGCEQDQIVIKSSGQVIMKLWAGDEYGWLTQYRYWSGSEENHRYPK